MKRILIYGACHAQVLRDLLSRVLPPDDFELTMLINFQLIAAGTPFPYAELPRYDMVIYSPIESKEGYNTAALREACAAIGCESICISWLEWHGYSPGAQKGIFKGRFQWHYPQLLTLAEDFPNFDAFYDHVIEHFPEDDVIDRVFEASTTMMRGSEERNQADIRVSGFIAKQFQSSRLFMISDHPALKLYEEVIAQILVALKYRTELKLAVEEPQGEIRIPIFPKVARRLGLKFLDTDWVDDAVLPGMVYDLRTYLRLYYYPASVILGPLQNARIFSQDRDIQTETSAAGTKVAPATRLLARPVTQTTGDTLVDYELLETLDAPSASNRMLKTFAINPEEWRSTWNF